MFSPIFLLLRYVGTIGSAAGHKELANSETEDLLSASLCLSILLSFNFATAASVGMPPCSRPRAWGFRAQLNMEATFTTCPVSSQHLLVPPASSFLHLSGWEVLFLYFRGETF